MHPSVRSFYAHCCSVALLSPTHSNAVCQLNPCNVFPERLLFFFFFFAKQRIMLQYKTWVTKRIRKNNNKKYHLKKKNKPLKGKEHNMLLIPYEKSCLIISSQSLKTKVMLPLRTQTINMLSPPHGAGNFTEIQLLLQFSSVRIHFSYKLDSIYLKHLPSYHCQYTSFILLCNWGVDFTLIAHSKPFIPLIQCWVDALRVAFILDTYLFIQVLLSNLLSSTEIESLW